MEKFDSAEAEKLNEHIEFPKKVPHQREKKCMNIRKKSTSDKNHVGDCDKKQKKKQTNDQNKEVGKNRTKRKQRK